MRSTEKRCMLSIAHAIRAYCEVVSLAHCFSQHTDPFKHQSHSEWTSDCITLQLNGLKNSNPNAGKRQNTTSLSSQVISNKTSFLENIKNKNKKKNLENTNPVTNPVNMQAGRGFFTGNTRTSLRRNREIWLHILI